MNDMNTHMRLVLCSEGFHTQNTVDACVKLVGKPQDEITIAVINEAFAVEDGDKRWVLDNLNSVAKHFPAELDIVDLLALPMEEVEKRIRNKDVIFVVGGNTDYLMHVFNKSGFTELLPKLLEDKVYVGSSAGSMVIGKRISTEAYTKIYGEDQDFGVTEYMNLVDLAIKPHLDSNNFPNNRANTLDKHASGADFPVYGLRDDSAIVIDGENQDFIGSDPHEVKR
jgi:dipeptidase E